MAYMRKKGNKWYYTIYFLDENGIRKSSERVGGLTKAECKMAYTKAEHELQTKGVLPVTSREEKLVQDLLYEWLEDVSSIENKSNTFRQYKSIIDNHIVPAIGKRKLSSIKPKHLQKFINEKSTKFKQATVDQITTVLKQAFKYGVSFCDYLSVDPAAPISKPKAQKSTYQQLPFRPEHIECLMQRFPLGHQYYAPSVISYNTGLRLGECLALTWDDIDMKNRIITVTKTVITKDNKAVVQAMPKSESSIREVNFGQKLYDALRKIRMCQNRTMLEKGPYYHRNNLVCDWHDGLLFRTENFNFFNEFCRKTFGKGYSFHSFRHMHATMLLEDGEDLEIVSKRLGHSNLNTTARIYSHVLEKRTKKLITRLDEIL